MTIEKTLFAAADKMRGSMDPGEYKHVALGLLYLRYPFLPRLMSGELRIREAEKQIEEVV